MNRKARPYLYSLPSMVIVGLIIVFPILYTGYISLTNMNIYHWFNYRVIGFSNYSKALFVFNNGFIPALLRTILWTVLNIVIQVVIAFLIAVLLNSEGLKLKNVYKTLLMFPWAMPAYVSILLWRLGIYNSQFGLLNHLLNAFGMNSVDWLNGNISAFVCCMVVNLWMAFPFMILTMDGAIQSIDKAYYESSMLEGASAFTRMAKITFPMIKPIIMPAIVLTAFTTFKQFDIVYLMTQQTGANTGADIHTVITYAYEKAFVTNNYGYSAAISILIFVIIIVFFVLTKNNMKEEGAQ